MYNMDLENGGGGALNNQQVLPQQEEEEAGGGVQLAIPDPAADYLSSRDMAFQCVGAVMGLSVGALLLGLGFAKALSVSHWAAFVACGVLALASACGLFAMVCCLGSNSSLWGLG